MLAVNENAKVLSVWFVSFPSKQNDGGRVRVRRVGTHGSSTYVVRKKKTPGGEWVSQTAWWAG